MWSSKVVTLHKRNFLTIYMVPFSSFFYPLFSSLQTLIFSMTGRRSSGSRITEDEVNELISKLQSLLPEARRHNLCRVCVFNFLLYTRNFPFRLTHLIIYAIGFYVEVAEGDVQVHQKSSQRSRRSQRPSLRSHVHHGHQ